ncbi:MAG: NAD(P)/FAD-dependent oxidoreductase [Bacteroidales bacterium]|nr:NAD(P)/FAD-dependent oxidoreductase [Bacteroidales bacterium]
MAEKFDVAIIGAGLGGLECGLMLAKHGKKVCVLEKDALIGGCLQTFRRKGVSLDTGFHYVGGLDKGQMLYKLFSFFGLMDLPWVKMDDFFDEVVIKGEHFHIAQGFELYSNTLKQAFPDNSSEIDVWVDLLMKVGYNIEKSFEPRDTEDFYTQSLFSQSAYDFLKKTFSNDTLIDVVSGPSLKMELHPEKLPLYTFAQINSSFIQSAYRLRGGGMQIAESLRRQIEDKGGVVRRNAKVTGVIEADGKIGALVVNDSESVEADFFISDIHPAATMNLMENTKLIRNIYRKRINGLENTFGMFTTHLILKPETIKYINNNIFAYTESDLWHISQSSSTGDVKQILISVNPSDDNSDFVRNIDILTPMNWSEVEPWFGTNIASRGNDYELMKKSVADKCIAEASKYIDGLQEAIEDVYTSTPLTYCDYTATKDGSAYGIRKDCNQLMFTVLTPRTPVPNLLLTGQSLNLHGILGTSMTSVFTCAEILGIDTIVNDLKDIK